MIVVVQPNLLCSFLQSFFHILIRMLIENIYLIALLSCFKSLLFYGAPLTSSVEPNVLVGVQRALCVSNPGYWI